MEKWKQDKLWLFCVILLWPFPVVLFAFVIFIFSRGEKIDQKTKQQKKPWHILRILNHYAAVWPGRGNFFARRFYKLWLTCLHNESERFNQQKYNFVGYRPPTSFCLFFVPSSSSSRRRRLPSPVRIMNQLQSGTSQSCSESERECLLLLMHSNKLQSYGQNVLWWILNLNFKYLFKKISQIWAMSVLGWGTNIKCITFAKCTPSKYQIVYFFPHQNRAEFKVS